MKPRQNTTMHHLTSSIVGEVEMGIDQSAMAHVMSILTDLYSDQQLAFIREYSTNARDSNIEAGNNVPIEVTLPTAMRPTFTVRDHGIGLDEQAIREIYSMYGASTKRESDDVNGMLGLGCKSGLTYTSQFTVAAVRDGIRTIAAITKNEAGVGTIKILAADPTSEPTGVTVTIPINPNDIPSVCDKAHSFYRYWEPGTVLVDGEEPELIRNLKSERYLWVDDNVLVDSESRSHENSYVVMGNVAYPFKMSAGGYGSRNDFSFAVVAWIPMGAVHFTPSREALMTTDHTNKTIENLKGFIRERFKDRLTDEITSQPDNWSKYAMWQTWKQRAWNEVTDFTDYVDRNDLGPAYNDTKRPPSIMLPDRALNCEIEHRQARGSVHTVETLVAHGLKQEDGIYLDGLRKKDGRLVRQQDHQLVTIVTNYPHRSLTPTARLRLNEWLANTGRMQVFLFPENSDLTAIDGRPHVIDWQDVLDATTEPTPAQRTARSKDEVLYRGFRSGVEVHNRGEWPAQYNPVVYAPAGEVSLYQQARGWRWRPDRRGDHLKEVSVKFPDVTFVSIGAQQVEKFKRLHPKSEHWKAYCDAQEAKLIASMTEDDLEREFIHDEIINLVKNLRPYYRADDPDMLHILDLVDHPRAKAEQLKLLGLTVNRPKDDQRVVRLRNRYPLFGAIIGLTLDGPGYRDLAEYITTKQPQQSV